MLSRQRERESVCVSVKKPSKIAGRLKLEIGRKKKSCTIGQQVSIYFRMYNFLLQFMMGYDMGGGSEGSGIHISSMAWRSGRFVTASENECYSQHSQFKNNNEIN